MIKITDIINMGTRNTHKVVFDCYRVGKLYYNVVDGDNVSLWQFPVDITDTNDIGNATFSAVDKAATYMRYIRKAIANDELIKLTGA